MTKILYLAYHFPPIGGAGVQRNAKFVRYLPEFGYDPIVITGPGPVTGRWTPTDETMASEIGADITVRRLGGVAPAPSPGLRGRIEILRGLVQPFADDLASEIDATRP